ncbi:MAG: ABC transporter permease [Ruminococcaceae bacterium]|jgi:ribose transport system permease protein|nr:ABC transporter permease [Oscillospiraceae bacterium]
MKKTNLATSFTKSKSFPLIIILVVMAVITAVVSHGRFFAAGNMLTVLYGMVIQIIMLCGLGLILISGNIDLSVGGQAALCTLIFAWLCKNTAMPWGIVLLITLVFALCLGLVNTLLVNKLRFPAFIATIGMSSVYRGLCSVMTGGDNIQITRQSFLAIGKTNLFGFLPISFVFALVVLAIFQFILSYTRFGRNIFMVGGNPIAARLSGLNPDRSRMILFLINSAMACVGGLLWSAQAKLASPVAIIDAAPDMQVISAAILGGIAFTGGSGNLVGGLVGVLLLNIFKNMLIIMGIPTYWTVFAQGFVLAIALAIDFISNERRRKALLAASAAAEAAEAAGLSS